MTLLEDTLAAIRPVDMSLEPSIRAHLDDLCKPPGSLGKLEELAMRYCLAVGSASPKPVACRICVFAGDHGVTAEGVSAYPSAVTPQMVQNMLQGGAAINVLSRHVGAQVSIVDVGVAAELPAHPQLGRFKVRAGTGNIAREPAMTMADACKALEIGIEQAGAAIDSGITLLGTGDMGIGNTTPSAALLAALLPIAPRRVIGRGTGIDDQGLERKREAVMRALSLHEAQLADPLRCLSAVGGLEIAGIAGLVLGAAARQVPVVVDGFISTAAALVAMRMRPPVEDYLFFSHCSAEAGHSAFFEKLGKSPLLDLRMRLGEGTGAALAISIIGAAVRVYLEMATFSSAGVSGRV
ncbi:MAG: nicotinate-nucleotide--dimethylbenzimidazole phosphoribosyltransferase [Myxococcota bacterium]|jgi:nicotinate-nucleotide--dimethylbenzimidazole phosphoribosyltransferase|nr:nicotinate-nucleotide--dimethylbenzimidazole phosphoribosyltransferase [Myxococcota bacterium]